MRARALSLLTREALASPHIAPLAWRAPAAVTVAAAQLARRTALLAKQVQLPARLLLQAASMRVLKLQEVTVSPQQLAPSLATPAGSRVLTASTLRFANSAPRSRHQRRDS